MINKINQNHLLMVKSIGIKGLCPLLLSEQHLSFVIEEHFHRQCILQARYHLSFDAYAMPMKEYILHLLLPSVLFHPLLLSSLFLQWQIIRFHKYDDVCSFVVRELIIQWSYWHSYSEDRQRKQDVSFLLKTDCALLHFLHFYELNGLVLHTLVLQTFRESLLNWTVFCP